MKRLLTFAALSLLALTSSVFAADPVVRDHRTTKTATGPVIRDHRIQIVVAPKNSTSGATIRDHRTTTPYVVNGNSGAVVRDHRTVASNSGSGYQVPKVSASNGPVVRDHRNGAGFSGGVTVTSSPRPRQPVDNTVYGSGPGISDLVDGIGSAVSGVGNAIGDGLGAVGNVFGIGYGSITPAAPTGPRPRGIDDRR